jgi:hypothetical protein
MPVESSPADAAAFDTTDGWRPKRAPHCARSGTMTRSEGDGRSYSSYVVLPRSCSG